MISRLLYRVTSVMVSSDDGAVDEGERERSIRIATAVLMVDVARADHNFDEQEFQALLDLIATHFDLSPQDANELANSASEQAEELVSLHEFTQLLHNNLTETEKAQVVSLLWQVAYADSELHKYEDSLVLKISDLLHVSRGKVMQLKHDAGRAAANQG